MALGAFPSQMCILLQTESPCGSVRFLQKGNVDVPAVEGAGIPNFDRCRKLGEILSSPDGCSWMCSWYAGVHVRRHLIAQVCGMFNCDGFSWLACFSRAWFSPGAFYGTCAECRSLSRHCFQQLCCSVCVIKCAFAVSCLGLHLTFLFYLGLKLDILPVPVEKLSVTWLGVPAHMQLEKLIDRNNHQSSSLTTSLQILSFQDHL